VLARVLEREPDLGALPVPTPEPIRRLLRRCLEKDTREWVLTRPPGVVARFASP
jgi:hypothetical protein